MPKISVVMPVYNGEKYLREAIDSILSQTYTDFEFIIIDDGSSDASPDIVREYKDPRIRFYINEQNKGVAATLNRGLDLATGEYIARMDSDDISLPERFEKQAKYMDEHNEIAVCATGIIFFGAKSGKQLFSSGHAQLKVDLIFGCCFAHPTVMMRSNVVGKNGYHYDVHFNKMEDYALWVKVSENYNLASIREPLLKYRVHASQVTQNYTDIYWEQDKILKTEILKRLSLSEATYVEIFQKATKNRLNDNERKQYIDLLNKMLSANTVYRIYEGKNLKDTLYFLIRRELDKFPISEAKEIASANGMNGTIYVAGRILHNIPYRIVAKIRLLGGTIRLKNKDFTIISNNCWGGFIYQKYGLEYRTPTIGLFFLGDDYVKFCRNLDYYLEQPIQFIPWESARWYPEMSDSQPYPVGKLDDIEVYFMHYHSEDEVLEKWERRKKRINKNKLIVKMSQRECCSKADIEAFMELPYPNKVCFAYDDVPGTIRVPELEGFSGDEQPVVTPYLDDLYFLNHIEITD